MVVASLRRKKCTFRLRVVFFHCALRSDWAGMRARSVKTPVSRVCAVALIKALMASGGVAGSTSRVRTRQARSSMAFVRLIFCPWRGLKRCVANKPASASINGNAIGNVFSRMPVTKLLSGILVLLRADGRSGSLTASTGDPAIRVLLLYNFVCTSNT